MSILLEEALAILHVRKWACYNLSMCSLEASCLKKCVKWFRWASGQKRKKEKLMRHKTIINSTNKKTNRCSSQWTYWVGSYIHVARRSWFQILKKRKTAFPTVKNILFDRKITFFAIDNNIFCGTRSSFENVVVADQVLINAFAIVACRCDTTTSPVFFCIW